jgi:TRAP-type C4-dicarboxylate transport system substrate-binding protein
VDGAENNWPSYESTGHFEVAKYYSISQHLIIPEILAINVTVYNSLSPKMQKILKEAARESALLQRKLWKERSKASEKKVMAGGAVVNAIPYKSDFQAAMKPVYDKFLAENPNLKPLVKIIQDTP